MNLVKWIGSKGAFFYGYFLEIQLWFFILNRLEEIQPYYSNTWNKKTLYKDWIKGVWEMNTQPL